MAVFVMGVAPVLGLLTANSRQFQDDQNIFQENDVLFEKAAAVRKKFAYPYDTFDETDDFWDAEKSPRYSGIYSVASFEPVGEFGYIVTIGVGSDEEAKDALFLANGDPDENADPKHESLQQYTLFLVKKKKET